MPASSLIPLDSLHKAIRWSDHEEMRNRKTFGDQRSRRVNFHRSSRVSRRVKFLDSSAGDVNEVFPSTLFRSTFFLWHFTATIVHNIVVAVWEEWCYKMTYQSAAERVEAKLHDMLFFRDARDVEWSKSCLWLNFVNRLTFEVPYDCLHRFTNTKAPHDSFPISNTRFTTTRKLLYLRIDGCAGMRIIQDSLRFASCLVFEILSLRLDRFRSFFCCVIVSIVNEIWNLV